MAYVDNKAAVGLVSKYIGECKFLDLDEDRQAGFLERASLNIDSLSHINGLAYKGVKLDEKQEHEFPRDFQEEVPFGVKLACIIEAVIISEENSVERLSMRRQGISSISLGGSKESYEEPTGIDAFISKAAFAYLIPYIEKRGVGGIK